MTSTAYDEVAYPSAVYSQTHPDRLSAVAILGGMQPAPVEKCRVLELGCGDGFNLISMAYALPGSEFTGIDLAAQPVARGASIVAKLGLRNVSLHARDVAEAGPELGEFDYIIAHGLYSWVPPHVRDRVMEICGRNLSANGVAYVSYNAYPGNHLRDLVRGMMRYHAAHFPGPQDQIAQARGLVKLLAGVGGDGDPYRGILSRELERITKYTDAAFFHDDLSAWNRPVYFHEFIAHAQRNGLQFLAEADVTDREPPDCPPQVRAVLDQLDPADVIGAEQYRDFVTCRAFRQTLLCRGGIPLVHGFDASGVQRLFLSGEFRSATPQADPAAATPELFTGRKNAELESDRPLVKAALRHLGALWPAGVSFHDLLAHARGVAGRTGGDSLAADADDLSNALLQAAIAGFLDLRGRLPRFATQPGVRPLASAVARAQLESGDRVSTLLHGIVRIEDAMARKLLTLLDGTRDRRELRDALEAAVRSGEVKPAAASVEISDAELEAMLARLARLALLVAQP